MRRSAPYLLLLGMLGASQAAPAGAVPAAAVTSLAVTAPAAQAPLDAGRAAAARQLRRTERALAATAAAARGRAELARSTAAARPFWAALDRLSRALQAADQGLRAAGSQYFVAVGLGSRALAELEGVWARVPSRPPSVASRVAALSAAYRRLRNGYGWEALRRQQGGSLTPVEARRFRALRQADARVAATLKPVQAKAAKTGDSAMAAQLARLRDQAQRVASAELTLEAYLTAELLNDIVQGEWAASQSYVRKPYRATYHKSASTIDKLATDPGVGFVFTADLSKAESWTFDAGSENAAATEPNAAAAAASGRTGAPAVDETPVDEVEIVEGAGRHTDGVVPDPAGAAEGGDGAAASEPGAMRQDPDVIPPAATAPTSPAEAVPPPAPTPPTDPVPPAEPPMAVPAEPLTEAPPAEAPQAEAPQAEVPQAEAPPDANAQAPEGAPPDRDMAPAPPADPTLGPPADPPPAEPPVVEPPPAEPPAAEPPPADQPPVDQSPPADETPLPIDPPQPPPAPSPAPSPTPPPAAAPSPAAPAA